MGSCQSTSSTALQQAAAHHRIEGDLERTNSGGVQSLGTFRQAVCPWLRDGRLLSYWFTVNSSSPNLVHTDDQSYKVIQYSCSVRKPAYHSMNGVVQPLISSHPAKMHLNSHILDWHQLVLLDKSCAINTASSVTSKMGHLAPQISLIPSC